ncbi:hypothetical protein D1164_12900 [Mariniphaga sediminis]|uniref:Uncharacterized protein n=1 Tax=Mariniphaga sediminis TaxID=1628158 RepID=A0A399D3G0_9BACT|nr:hypothetical protein [Mariniphaga sediminis]RIH64930.1 hypothetical protein D1164_12900 [Mariniphaga sediminis]
MKQFNAQRLQAFIIIFVFPEGFSGYGQSFDWFIAEGNVHLKEERDSAFYSGRQNDFNNNRILADSAYYYKSS